MAGITSDLAKKSGDPLETPLGGSPGGLRMIFAGTTLLVHMVLKKCNYFLRICLAKNLASFVVAVRPTYQLLIQVLVTPIRILASLDLTPLKKRHLRLSTMLMMRGVRTMLEEDY
jgi:hypothetical protein